MSKGICCTCYEKWDTYHQKEMCRNVKYVKDFSGYKNKATTNKRGSGKCPTYGHTKRLKEECSGKIEQYTQYKDSTYKLRPHEVSESKKRTLYPVYLSI